MKWMALHGVPRGQLGPSGIAALRRFVRMCDLEAFSGILVPDSNDGWFEPCFVAHEILMSSVALAPMIAANPIYIHPFAMAKYLANISVAYERRMSINLITGTSNDDRARLGDQVPHDERYDRLWEFAHVITRLLRGERVVFAGRYYRLDGVQLHAHIEPNLLPQWFVAGASAASMAVAGRLGATRLIMAPPLEQSSSAIELSDVAIHCGIVARPTRAEAIAIVETLAPSERAAELQQTLSSIRTDSVWKRELHNRGRNVSADGSSVYSLVQFMRGRSDVPCLVGDYEAVADYLAEYEKRGVGVVIVEVSRIESLSELTHINKVRALVGAGATNDASL